jgi:hypothetical protein
MKHSSGDLTPQNQRGETKKRVGYGGCVCCCCGGCGVGALGEEKFALELV